MILDTYDRNKLQEILDRKDSNLSYSELYFELYGVDICNDEARKRFKGIENHIDHKSLAEGNSIKRQNKVSIKTFEDGSIERTGDIELEIGESLADEKLILEKHGYNPNCFKITSSQHKQWNIGSKDTKTLYSSCVKVKPIVPDFDPEWIQNAIDNLTVNIDLPTYERQTNDNGKIVEVNFADVHLGKYVNTLVSNGEYNLDIAIELYQKSIQKAIEYTSHLEIDRIVYVLGQDMVNVDNIQGTTTKGTPQKTPTFYQELYERSFDCIFNTCEMLRKVAPLDIVYVKGNHDKQVSFDIIYGINKIYEQKKKDGLDIDVTVDYSLKQRKYKQFGDVLIGYSHGEEEGKNIYDCMQNDVPELWHSKYRYFHLSHIHKERNMLKTKDEIGGVLFQWLGSLSGTCEWTYGKGFVGSQRKGHVFVYDKQDGVECEFFVKP
jgi:hypothetical protein